MDFNNLSQLFGPFQDQFVRVYSVTSFVISVLIALWLFNFIFGLIQRTYSIGKAFGSVYRLYMHSYLRGVVIKVLNIFKPANEIKNNI
tara:strand:+ start:4170 stop:4433 length:264 start_codon:yes stop_codon:yes gene_type:complete